MHDSAQCRSNCPINFVLETFGDKWTLLIVRDLMFKEKRTSGEFLSSAEGISTNILAERLRRLEDAGIITSTPAEDRRSTVYSLTQKGKDLLPIMLEITAWSAKYDARTNAPKDFLKMFRDRKRQLMSSILAKLK
jgi:DNA-binding HxlR family transcriptional regulator